MIVFGNKRKILVAALSGALVVGAGIWQVVSRLYQPKQEGNPRDAESSRSVTEPCGTPGISDTDCLLDQKKGQQKSFFIGSGGFYY